MKKLFRFLFDGLFGYHKINRYFDSEEDIETIPRLIKKIRPYTMLSLPRLVSLYTQVRYCEQNNVKGGYMECGVWKGGAVGLMALTNQLYGAKRRDLFLFDSFDNICPPDPELDGIQAMRDVLKYANKADLSIRESKTPKPIKGFYDSFGGKGTLSQNKQLLFSQIQYDKHYVHFFKGWFEKTIPKASKNIEDLAILRIDADWYKSVSICLEYFYQKVVKGGFIIIDDYGYYEGCTKAVKEYFFKHHIHSYPNSVDSGCVYFIK